MRMVVSVIITVVVIMPVIFVMPFYQFLSTCFGVDFFFLCATSHFALCIVSMLVIFVCIYHSL
ncbi:Uncharacterised protein [Mycobacterium tuberculosis]|nr:Uncharacterised protein [Mycobacterium tuberculosis]